MGEGRRWYAGKSPREREQYAREVIFSLLPKDGGEIRWSALEEGARRSGISPTTLSAHLGRLVGLGIVKRRVDASTRPPSVLYSLSEPIPTAEGGRGPYFATADLPATLTVVARAGARAADARGELLKLNVFNLISELLHILRISLGGGRAEAGSPGRRIDEARGRADELLDGRIRPLIHKLLEDLGEGGGAVLEEFIGPFLDRVSEALGGVGGAPESPGAAGDRGDPGAKGPQ